MLSGQNQITHEMGAWAQARARAPITVLCVHLPINKYDINNNSTHSIGDTHTQRYTHCMSEYNHTIPI